MAQIIEPANWARADMHQQRIRFRLAAAVVGAPDRHDRGTHGYAAEGDDQSKEQQPRRDKRRAIGHDEIAQPMRIEREQPAKHQRGRRHADGKIDRKQPEQRLAEKADRCTRA